MKRFILFLLVGALLILPLSGCFVDNQQNEGTTPNNTTPETTTPEETTHDIIYPDPPEPRYAMSAQAPTEWEIANGDIPISLSFGLKEYCSVDDMFSNIVIYLVNSEDQTHVFKKIDIAEIEKPEYVVEYVYDEERQVVGFNYAHTETVNLPLSLFSEDSGFVQILMRDWVDDGTDEGQYGAGGGTILYYKRNGETTLIISDKPIQESTTPDNPPEVTTPDNPAIDVPNYERLQELDEIFTWLEEKEDENSKIVFFTLFEGVEQILKNNGTYDSYDVWIPAHFSVSISCDYSKAVNEDWYPKTSPTDIKALNEAFYNFYKDDFSDDAFVESSLSSNYLSFVYYKSEDFLVDYTALEKLLDLPYVTSLEVVYYFPYPISAE